MSRAKRQQWRNKRVTEQEQRGIVGVVLVIVRRGVITAGEHGEPKKVLTLNLATAVLVTFATPRCNADSSFFTFPDCHDEHAGMSLLTQVPGNRQRTSILHVPTICFAQRQFPERFDCLAHRAHDQSLTAPCCFPIRLVRHS